MKIKHELKQRHVSEYCIKKALKAIDEDEYIACLQKIAALKLATLKSEKNIFIMRKKLQNYLVAKGFEADLIRSEIKI